MINELTSISCGPADGTRVPASTLHVRGYLGLVRLSIHQALRNWSLCEPQRLMENLRVLVRVKTKRDLNQRSHGHDIGYLMDVLSEVALIVRLQESRSLSWPYVSAKSLRMARIGELRLLQSLELAAVVLISQRSSRDRC